VTLSLLSPREEAVLLLIGDGLGLREIACRMGVTPRAARRLRESARTKLGATTTTHAVAIVVKARAHPTASAPGTAPGPNGPCRGMGGRLAP
jgi:DNA-binding CsgD family transcriptional regulator